MPIEVDENELARLRTAEKIMGELTNSPKTKREVERAIKVLHPEVVTEEDREQAFMKPLMERIDKLELRNKQLEDDKVERAFQDRLAHYRSTGYTDEGIEKVKTLMKERTIPDVDAAVALYEKMEPKQPQAPSGFKPQEWGLGRPAGDDKDLALLYKDEDAWAEQEAAKAWNDAVKGNF